jgi:hypothetical protein
MENSFTKASGISLIAGSLLMIATMVLHPAGGSMEHIFRIRNAAMISHALAIFTLPFMAFGFYGLSALLHTKSRLSILSFIIACFGLLAGMIAATINGLTLPLFVASYSSQMEQAPALIKPIVQYGSFINKPMDYILMAALSLSIFIWSLLIIRSACFPKWVGYYGMAIIPLGVLAVLFKFDFTSLFGFRVFVFSMTGWILGMGVLMTKSRQAIV